MHEPLRKVCRSCHSRTISFVGLLPVAPVTTDDIEVLGFFESLEHDRIQAERAKLLEQKKVYPIAPDGNTRLFFTVLFRNVYP